METVESLVEEVEQMYGPSNTSGPSYTRGHQEEKSADRMGCPCSLGHKIR